MFTYISIEEFADGVVKNNKDANRRELIAPRLLCNMAFLKLHKNIAFQNVLRVSKNVSPVNPVLNRVAQDVELC